MSKTKKHQRFPSRDEILEFIESASGKVTKREIANAFYIKGEGRVRLKKVLRQLLDEGAIERDPGKRLRPAGKLPSVMVVETRAVDEYGDIVAVPDNWKKKEKPPRIFIVTTKKERKTIGIGERALVRLNRETDEHGEYYSASIIRVLKGAPRTFIGVFHITTDGFQINPTDKKDRNVYDVARDKAHGAYDNALVLAEPLSKPRGRQARHLKPTARVIENLGDLSEPKSISLIAIHHHDIPHRFPKEVLDEAKSVSLPSRKGRTDLRKLPFLTIDPADARDHDDAIFAEPDPSPKNKGGWKISVAIADVAHFVAPGSKLDKEARFRGNSCYFPDRVVPMLPDVLSGNLCSLVKKENRPVFVCHFRITSDGKKLDHKFERATINCVENLSYQEVQESLDKKGGPYYSVLEPLWKAYQALARARENRAPLKIEKPERKVILNKDGTVKEVIKKPVLPAHKIVEECMVSANVCAAETLVKRNVLCMFRVHEEPGADKLETLRSFLKTIGLKFPKGPVTQPKGFNHLLDKVKDTKLKDMVNDMVLRTQMQAYYSPENLGHFGLNLTKYAHFTSPIRRYADVLVHRGLITALGLGKDGLGDKDLEAFRQIGEEISNTERRAMAAERESTDRYLAQFLSRHVGEHFKGRIGGVTRFGLFANVEPSGADGFIPMSTLRHDYFQFDERHQRLRGRRTGQTYTLGDMVDLRLVEADKFTGGLRFEMLTGVRGGGKRSKKHRHKGKKRR